MPLFNDVPTQQIITSASVPSNPTQGLTWNELDSSNNLVETWIRNNNKWFSQPKEYSGGIGNSTINFSEYLAIATNRDIYVQDLIYHLYNSSASTYSYVFYLHREYATLTRITLFQSANITIPVNSRVSYVNSINTLYSPFSTECLLSQCVRNGGIGTVFAAYKVNYREVRK
jgi:hypothetical protein